VIEQDLGFTQEEVGGSAEFFEASALTNTSVEQVAVSDEQSLSAWRLMNCFHEDWNSKYFLADKLAKLIVVVSGNVEYFRAGPREADELGYDLHVQVAKSRFRFHALQIDDIANEIDSICFDFG
jgi:hypothetical protein